MESLSLPLHPPLRSACARCHSQKLRCPGRSGNDQACARCIKASAACIFGTSVRGKRPATVAAQGLRTASDMDNDFPTAKRVHIATRTSVSDQEPEQLFSIPALDWSPALDEGNFTDPLANSQGTSTPTSTSTAVDTATITNAHIQVVENLTQLNLSLIRHAQTIPPLTSPPPDFTKSAEPFKLDDIFQITTAFLDVVRSLQLEEGSDRHSPGSVVVDAATVFLVMSCWRRLADMYDCLFVLVRRCAEQSVLPAAREGNPVSLPAVTIGSFVPDATTSILLQMVATLQHSTQLINHMSDFAVKMSLEEGFISTDETCSTDLHRRASNMHQQVRSIKSMLVQTGLL
ncbi:hypothetical protein F4804DRAFT_58551 [Jackrogersella minutella]|nr:hypothetical protein F4804DRAFT_58551 [Jackrogersella minutella]